MCNFANTAWAAVQRSPLGAKGRLTGLLLGTAWLSGALVGTAGGDPRRDLTQASLEELMQIEVTSVSRKEQKLAKTAAAAFVITQEDIRRSGVSTIPEVLRMAPGIQVARIDSNKWAISARGFNSRFSNKLLVLVDGRSVYNNLYAGVYWEQLDLMLEDIDRIEVIRGPGATMWGANAVNGVINIVTKHTRQTEGALVSITTGTEDHAVVAARLGVKSSDALSYRLYSHFSSRDNLRTASGGPAADRWTATRGGGRIDWEISSRDSLTVLGDLYEGDTHETLSPNFPYVSLMPPVQRTGDFHGGFAQAIWDRTYSEHSGLRLQFYFDETRRKEAYGAGRFGVADFDFQHRRPWGRRHDVMWGLGYRFLNDRIDTGQRTSFVPPSRSDHLYSSFLQDDIALMPDRFVVTVGSKFQHNAYSGFEVQPSLRLLWTPDDAQGAWAAVSRAVRTPVRRDQDLCMEFSLPPGTAPNAVGRLAGDRTFLPENVLAYEAGYRRQVSSRVSVDAAAFYNVYDRLQSIESGAPFLEASPETRLIFPLYYGNGNAGRTYGTELATAWSLKKGWTLTASHSWLVMKLHRTTSLPAAMDRKDDGRNPRHQVQLRSLTEWPAGLSLDVSGYYVARLPAIRVPAYWRVDAHVGWRPTASLEIRAGGQNLLDDRHREFLPEDYVVGSEARRAFYLKVTGRF